MRRLIRGMGAALACLPIVAWRQAAAAPAGASCLGGMRVTPAVVHLGGTFTVSGSGFTCRTPNGLLFHPAIILYRPGLGFAIYTVAARPTGRYTLTTKMPRTLIPVSALSGGSSTRVGARPGTYYLTVRLSDVYLPPPAQAMAHVRVER